MPKLINASTDAHQFTIQGTAPATPDANNVRLYFSSTGLRLKDENGTIFVIYPYDQALFVPASEMYPSTTNGCAALAQTEYATNDIDLRTLDFDQTSAEYAQFSVRLPNSWDDSILKANFTWTASAGTMGQNVQWNIQAMSWVDDDAIEQAWGGSVEVQDEFHAVDDYHISPTTSDVLPSGSVDGGQLVQFRVWRDATNDTLAADAKLIGITLFYR